MNNFTSVLKGGNQEQGLRPGTGLSALAYALGNACEIAVINLSQNQKKINFLTNKFYLNLTKDISELKLLGPDLLDRPALDRPAPDHSGLHHSGLDSTARLPGNLNIYFPKIESKNLVSKISAKVCCSTGSACLSNSGKNSHVLESLPVNEEIKAGAIRFGISKLNTEEEIDNASQIIIGSYFKLISKKNETHT